MAVEVYSARSSVQENQARGVMSSWMSDRMPGVTPWEVITTP